MLKLFTQRVTVSPKAWNCDKKELYLGQFTNKLTAVSLLTLTGEKAYKHGVYKVKLWSSENKSKSIKIHIRQSAAVQATLTYWVNGNLEVLSD